MRLAIDLRPLLEPYESGVTCYTKSMVKELLKKKDLELDLYYQARSRCEAIHSVFPTVRHLPLSNTRFHLRSLFGFPTLPDFYFLQKPDLIWIPDRRPFYKSDIPLVMTLHDRVPEFYRSTLSLKGRLWHSLFPLRRLLQLCSGILVPTFTVGETLRSKLPKEVTYAGARLSKNQEIPERARSLLKAPFFLMISPSDPRKRLHWFFQMAERFPKAHFAVIGLKPKESRFATPRLAGLKKRANIFLYPEVSDEEKSWFLHHARALLALSRYEGFDLPVLEAVKARCPVIMSGISVHHELYKTSAAFVNTLQELEVALYRALEGTVQVPVPRGLYSWGKAADRALFFFLRVLANKNRKSGGHGNGHNHPHNAQGLQPDEHGRNNDDGTETHGTAHHKRNKNVSFNLLK